LAQVSSSCVSRRLVPAMAKSIHELLLVALGSVVEVLLERCNHLQLFWGIIAITAVFYSYVAALIASVAALFAWLASMARPPSPLPRYKGQLDVYLGRSHRASTLTPDMTSNNNVSIASFRSQMVVAYRKAETHFASPSARIIVATSTNLQDWETVWEYTTGKDDLREVLLWEFKGKLFLYFACLAPQKKGFAPRGMHWTVTSDLQSWADPVAMGRAAEITWDIKVHEDQAYKVGYIGNHYAADAELTVVFEKSRDGVNWQPVGKDLAVYVGGISEVSFAFTACGDLVAIGRNEDGDRTGFGSQMFFARKDDLGTWVSLKDSLPYRFDSPRLVSMEGQFVLFARYAPHAYNAMPKWFPFGLQRFLNLIIYSARPKSAAVYWLDLPDNEGSWPVHPVQLVRCFEDACSDTGFFSVAKCPDSAAGSASEWAVANYSSSGAHSHAPWVYGQLLGSDVYVCRCLPVLRG